MKVHNLSELLDRELRYLYCVETQVLEALENLAPRVSSPEVDWFLRHKKAVTVWQRERLRTVPRALGLKLGGQPCHGLNAILAEGDALIERIIDDETRDVLIIAVLRRVEAFEKACYESAVRHAQLLGEETAVDLFQRNLVEEEDAEEALDRLERELNLEESAPAEGQLRSA